MKYSSEETKQIRENLKKIEEWIRENIVPKIEGETNIMVGFGPEISSVYRPKPHNKYEMHVGNEGDIWFRVGASSMYFTEETDELHERSIYDEYPGDVQPIFENWSHIKQQLDEEAAYKLESKNSMIDFQL